MVKVYFELDEGDIISTSKYFNNSYTEEWLDAWAERVIREVDSSESISAGMVCNLPLGPIMEDFIRWRGFILNLTG